METAVGWEPRFGVRDAGRREQQLGRNWRTLQTREDSDEGAKKPPSLPVSANKHAPRELRLPQKH